MEEPGPDRDLQAQGGTPHSPSPAGVYLVWDGHAQARPFLSYCLDLLSFRLLVAEDNGGSATQNVLRKVSNPTAGWLAETFEFALRTGHDFHAFLCLFSSSAWL